MKRLLFLIPFLALHVSADINLTNVPAAAGSSAADSVLGVTNSTHGALIRISQIISLARAAIGTNTTPSVTPTNAGSINTNNYVGLLSTSAQITGVWQDEHPIVIEPYLVYGANTYETNYWALADAWKTNGFGKIWHNAYISITDGWQGGRDASGNIYENSNFFPHGIEFTIHVFATNGIGYKVYTEPRDETTSTGYGSLGYFQQDASNYVRWGNNAGNQNLAVRMDLPNSPSSYYPGINSDHKYFVDLMRYWLNIYSQKPIPVTSTGWVTNEFIPTLGTVNGWYLVNTLGDLNGIGPNGPYCSFWTNNLAHWDLSVNYFPNGGHGAWQQIDWVPIFWNQGYYEMEVMSSGTLDIAFPYPPSSTLAFNQITNMDLKSMLDDPLGLPGKPIYRTATNELWAGKLANGDLKVLMFNRSTNATTATGFDVTQLGYGFGSSVAMHEAYYGTNFTAAGVYTNLLPPMQSLLFRVSLSGAPNQAQPAPGFGRQVIYNVYSVFGTNTTEANLIGYARCIRTNNLDAQGKQYILIPPGWQGQARDSHGNLEADTTRYPDGMSNTVYYIHTNGVGVIGTSSFLYRYQDGSEILGSGGPAGDLQYLSQDISNYVNTFKFDGQDFDYTYNVGLFSRNGTYSTYDGIAQRAFQDILGYSFPIINFAFDTNTTQIVPNGVNTYTVNGAYDTTTKETAWVSLLKMLSYMPNYYSQAGDGSYLSIYQCPLVFGEGHALADITLGSSLFFSVPEPPSYAPGFQIETNSYIKRVLYDSLGQPGSLIVSNANYLLFKRKLSGGAVGMTIFNQSTNATVTAGFTATDCEFPIGSTFNVVDVWACTNGTGMTTLTSTVPACDAQMFICSPTPSGFVMQNNTTTTSGALVVPGSFTTDGAITNNGVVWQVGTGAPVNGSLPDGSFYTDKSTGTFYIASNAVFQVIGPSTAFNSAANYNTSGNWTNQGTWTFLSPVFFGSTVTISNITGLTTVSNIVNLGSYYQSSMSASKLTGTDANTNLVSVMVGSGLSLSGGTLSATGGGGTGSSNITDSGYTAVIRNLTVSSNVLGNGAGWTNIQASNIVGTLMGNLSYPTNYPVTAGNGTGVWDLSVGTYGLFATNANITLSLNNTPISNAIPVCLILTNTGASGTTWTLTPSGFQLMTNGVPASAILVTNLAAKHQRTILSLLTYGPGLAVATKMEAYDP